MSNSEKITKHVPKRYTSSVMGSTIDISHLLIEYSHNSDFNNESKTCDNLQINLFTLILEEMKILKKSEKVLNNLKNEMNECQMFLKQSNSLFKMVNADGSKFHSQDKFIQKLTQRMNLIEKQIKYWETLITATKSNIRQNIKELC
ncbi:hypothetical protein RF11_09420 [Thelohanellus kitauei]|uniref:Uncharacterized protein n=1 Tax=Thelohanellus kitauei TaxID=669202 RepID=A0A0C2N6I7_THEKT|nr:hypothetical protein RF11_09420 [Thelohanellus kitauei]